ncbi:hypothetical protein [Halomicronema sp. CCY15110]|nr:hypothetical protein [Halomicronema sp. CCY15110]
MVLPLIYCFGLWLCPRFMLRWLTRAGYLLAGLMGLTTAIALLFP